MTILPGILPGCILLFKNVRHFMKHWERICVFWGFTDKLRGRTGFLDPPASYLHSKLILLWPELIEKCFRFWQTQRRCVIVKRTVKKAMWLLHFNNHNKYEFYFFIHSTYLLATQQQIEQKTTQCWTDALHCVLSFFRFTATKRNHSV